MLSNCGTPAQRRKMPKTKQDKELTLNREKLANLIYQEMGGQSSELRLPGCLALADAIIAKEHELFEVFTKG